MRIETTLTELARTPRRKRLQTLHAMTVRAMAAQPAEVAARHAAALRAAGYAEIANAVENLAWEAGFERRIAQPA